jgi:hypothetical protein
MQQLHIFSYSPVCVWRVWHAQVVNNVEAGVLEPALSKTKMIQVGWLLQQEATCNKTLHSCW